MTRNRTEEEGPLDEFLYEPPDRRSADPPRARNVAIYLSPGKQTTPLALRADVEHHGVFHEKVLIVSIERPASRMSIPADQFELEQLGAGLFKVVHLTIRAGYQDRRTCPRRSRWLANGASWSATSTSSTLPTSSHG